MKEMVRRSLREFCIKNEAIEASIKCKDDGGVVFSVLKCSTHCFLSKRSAYINISPILISLDAIANRCMVNGVYVHYKFATMMGQQIVKCFTTTWNFDRIAPYQKLIDINTSIIVTRPASYGCAPDVNLPYPMAASMPLKIDFLLFAEFREVFM